MSNVRLSVELVPDTAAGSNLRLAVMDGVRFPWEPIRKATTHAAGMRCEVCGGVGPTHPVECHEQWEYVVENGRHVQRLTGFVALCPACHGVKHYGLSQLREGRGDLPVGSTRAHLREVNGWTDEDVTEYLADQFGEHDERNRYEWWWDLTILSSYGIGPEWARVFAPSDRPTPTYDFAKWRE